MCIETLNIILQIILAILGIFAILVSGYKNIFPQISLSLISQYLSFSREKYLFALLKIKTDSLTAVMVEDVKVYCKSDNEKIRLRPFALRWKGFIPVMRDSKGIESHYKATGPFEPMLQNSNIESGLNECYLPVKSLEEVNLNFDLKIWQIEITYRSKSVFIPSFITRRTKRFDMAIDSNNLYFDDSLIVKITKEEADRLQKEL